MDAFPVLAGVGLATFVGLIRSPCVLVAVAHGQEWRARLDPGRCRCARIAPEDEARVTEGAGLVVGVDTYLDTQTVAICHVLAGVGRARATRSMLAAQHAGRIDLNQLVTLAGKVPIQVWS